MVIKGSATFRGRRRTASYVTLFLIIIATVAATASLLPTTTDDAMVIEGDGFILSGGVYGKFGSTNNYSSSDISAIVSRINNDNTPNAVFTITLTGDVSGFPGFVVYYSKSIILTSLPGEQFKITFATAKNINLYSNGTLTLENIILDGNNYGGGTGVQSYTELIMNSGAVIQNCTNSGIVVDANGKVTMNAGSVIRNCVAYLGGGVTANGILTMNSGAVIQNCSATSGGGGAVYVGSTGIFTMESGAVIQNCYSGANGGGVYNGGSFTMNGGKISGNYLTKTSSNGGGVLNLGTFTMYGGEISGNTATNWGGGVYSNSIFTMYGGEISGNTSTNLGGGLYNAGNNTFTMSGDAAISNNKALMGGGIYSTGLLNIISGTISDNTATSKSTLGSGGGIYTTNFDKTKVGLENGTVIFSGNTAPTLRTKDIPAGADLDTNKIADLDDYANNIGSVVLDAVVLNALVGPLQNAPAYNNNDINYSSDTFAVLINIVPEGSGTVNVILGTNKPVAFTESGYFYVPSTTPTITLTQSPTSGSDYMFIDFTMEGKSVINIQTITKSTTITAVYALPNYTITVESDSGSVIDPMWGVKVPYKEDQTFTFSAKPGNNLTGVYVDGVLLSPEEMASGVYTFTGVDKNHSIKVVSDVKTGSGGGEGGTGTGPGNGTGTEPGDGTGTEPGDGTGTQPGDGTETGSGDGTGTEPGDGTGTGPGEGTGAGPGDGTETEPGDGTGTGSGEGTGTGPGDGTGTEPGDGTGTGTGEGTGTEPGDGTGTEPGDGTGTGTGEGTGTEPGDGTETEPEEGTGTGPGEGTGSGSGGNGTGTIPGGNGTGNGSGGNGTDNGSIGNGNGSIGSGPGSEGGSDVGSGNNGNGAADSEAKKGEWSVQSMICAVLAIFTGLIALVAGRGRFRKDDEERRSKVGIALRVLAMMIGIVSVIVFILTDDWGMTPVIATVWTPLIFILLLATLILAMVSFRFDRADS